MVKKKNRIVGRSLYLRHRSVHIDVQGIVHTALRGICYPSEWTSKSCGQKENWKEESQFALIIENLNAYLIWFVTILEILLRSLTFWMPTAYLINLGGMGSY